MFGSCLESGGEQRERDLDHRVALAPGHLVRVDEGHQEPEQLSQAGKAVRNEAPADRDMTNSIKELMVTRKWKKSAWLIVFFYRKHFMFMRNYIFS